MQTSPDASSAPLPAIDVAVVEDQREIRLGLTALIDRTPGFRSVGSYRSMEEGIDGIDHRVPRVVLCDIGLPGMSGLEGIKILEAKHPSLQVLMLTVYDDDDQIRSRCQGPSRRPARGLPHLKTREAREKFPGSFRTPPKSLLAWTRNGERGGRPSRF